MITDDLIEILHNCYKLDWDGIHGISHWRRVREIGVAIAARNGADLQVVEAFALLHDSCRWSNTGDAEHGARAAHLVDRLNGDFLKLSPLRLQYLQYACAHHNDGKITSNITIGTCWDADRLDLWRLNIEPDVAYLSTSVAKDEAFRVWASRLHHVDSCIHICGADEVGNYADAGITHLVRIINPGAIATRPSWFTGDYLQLEFGDVISESDAIACRTKAPTVEDVEAVLDLCRAAMTDETCNVLISCDYGASRSPAMAYVVLAEFLGVDNETVALETILRIRPDAVPNSLIVKLGDMVLGRKGSLVNALKSLHDDIGPIESYFLNN